MKASNIVLYALDNGGARRPLISLDPKDKQAAAKLQYATISEFQRAERGGIAHPDLRCVLETRESNESGTVTLSGEFVEIDTVTLAPIVGAPSQNNLELLFPAPVVAVPGADAAARLKMETDIQALIAKAVTDALAVQQRAMEALPVDQRGIPVSPTLAKKTAAAKAKTK